MVEPMTRRLRGAAQIGMDTAVGEVGRYLGLRRAVAFAALDPDEVAAIQLTKLRDLLAHAGARVPYYRDLFAALDFDARDVTSVDDLATLPVLTKDIIRAQGDRMLDEQCPRRWLIRRKTGGSTAEPMQFWVTRGEYERQQTTVLRSFALIGVWPGDSVAKMWGYDYDHWAANAFAPATGRLYLDAYKSDPATFDRWIDAMRRARTRMIYGYTSIVHDFARHLLDRAAVLPHLRAVCTTAETLFAAQREDIERATRAPVFDQYGCHEVPRLASECTHGAMHEAPDAAVIETPPDGALLTSLQSYAMPLIRYAVGDVLHRTDDDDVPCACGLPFRRLALEVGRVYHMYTAPDGGRIHPSYFCKPIYQIDAVREFQVRFGPDHRVELRVAYAPGRSDAGRAALARVTAEIGARIGDGRVSVREVDRIPRTRRGKRPVVVACVEPSARPRPD